MKKFLALKLHKKIHFKRRKLKQKKINFPFESVFLDNLNKSRREAAKLRLDCVKFKILLGRIVDENSIRLCHNDFLDIGLDEEVFEALKIEEYETLEEQDEPSSNCSSFQLNESTIVLIGGRERLGNVLPPLAPGKSTDDTENENKENLRNIVKEYQASVPVKSPTPSPKAQHQFKASLKLEMEKPLKLSKNLLEANQEQFEQTKQPRKQQSIVVKRIVIPSKTTAKPS